MKIEVKVNEPKLGKNREKNQLHQNPLLCDDNFGHLSAYTDHLQKRSPMTRIKPEKKWGITTELTELKSGVSGAAMKNYTAAKLGKLGWGWQTSPRMTLQPKQLGTERIYFTLQSHIMVHEGRKSEKELEAEAGAEPMEECCFPPRSLLSQEPPLEIEQQSQTHPCRQSQKHPSRQQLIFLSGIPSTSGEITSRKSVWFSWKPIWPRI